jgi:hypothetical protein
MDIPSQTAIQNQLSGKIISIAKKTFSKNGLIAALINGISFVVKDLYDYSDSRLKNNFWLNRLTLDELKEVGNFINKPLLNATQSKGYVDIIGANGVNIPQNSQFFSNGKAYNVISQQTLSPVAIPLTSVSRNGTIATAKMNSISNLATGLIISISGFTETNFNQSNVEITMLNDYEFAYTVAATGNTSDVNGVVSFIGAICEVISDEYGIATELPNGTELSSDIAVTKILVGFNGIIGGVDEETRNDYLTRLQSYATNNRNETTNSKIISFITQNFPQITIGKLLFNVGRILDVSSIIIDLAENPKTRKITTLQQHRLTSGEYFTSLTGSSESVLNINEINMQNRFVGKIYDDFNFSVFVNDETAEDNTSVNMKFTAYSNGLATIVLYKQDSIIKTLTNQEILAVNKLIEDNVSGASWYKIISAIPDPRTINITNITPNITTLKNAIKTNLLTYIKDNILIGDTLLKSQVDYVILNTVDNNGNRIKNGNSYSIDMVADFTTQETNILEVIINI